jgi:cell division protein FtsB
LHHLSGIRGFEALTVEALRELRGESAVIDSAQNAELKSLRAENAELRTRLEALEAKLAR